MAEERALGQPISGPRRQPPQSGDVKKGMGDPSGAGRGSPISYAYERAGGEWRPSGYSKVGAGGHRLGNLVKLYYVPVFALRRLLETRAPGHEFKQLRQADLVRRADELLAVSEADVDTLYESARYGQRLTFYLYMLPSEHDELDVQELQSVVDEIVAQKRPCRGTEACACREFECETCPHQIRLLDEEHWNGFRELRFRYYVSHRFLNADEQSDEVLQSRYGFLWLAHRQGTLAILTRDEQVNAILTRALAQCLQAVPQPVRFPKELLDKHFSIEKAKHLSYYDPGTGVRRCISGNRLWQRFEQEVIAREQEFARPSSLYDEEIAQGLVSGLGVMASKGKIYLTRALPTSAVRAWARQRLPELMRDVKELQAYQPTVQSQPLEAVQRMRLPSAGRAAINTIVDALLQSEREDLTSVSLPRTAFELYEALSGRYFMPYLRAQCGECTLTAELCPHCESQELDFEEQNVACKQCGATLSDVDSVTLACMDGHATTVPKAEAWSIAPNHWFQKKIARIFAEVGKVWDEGNDYFHIEGNTLYRLHKGKTDKALLPPVVQNYISNFWDPVTGQVHAGRGDIFTSGDNGRTAPTAVTLPAVAPRTSGRLVAAVQQREGEGDMLRREDIRPTVTYTPTFHGPIYGPTHAGSGDIRVSGIRYGMQVDELSTLFLNLSKLVEEQAPKEKKLEAMQEVGVLKEAIQAAKPNVSRMESVLNWFKRNIPQLAGAVTSVIVHPIVGRLVEAAGEVAADEFRHRFGR